MVTTLLPTSFMLRLPQGDWSEHLCNSFLYQDSGQEVVGPCTISVHVSPRPDQHASLIPLSCLLALGAKFPRVRSLQLHTVILKLDASPCDVPRFSLLESLSIDPWFSQLPGDAAMTRSLLSIFPHMPLLRSLRVYAPMTVPQEDQVDHELQCPDLPFSLERFVCFGTLAVTACAHLIAHSRRTLRELRINIVGDADADEALLISAIAQAAPRLRVLDLHLHGDGLLLSRVQPVFAALSRVETVYLLTPRNVVLQDALAVLVGTPARTVSLMCPRDPFHPGAAANLQLVFNLLQPRLRELTLLDAYLYDEDRRELLAHCRARRITCRIENPPSATRFRPAAIGLAPTLRLAVYAYSITAMVAQSYAAGKAFLVKLLR